MASARSTGRAAKAAKAEGTRVIARNRRARHDYDVLEAVEAGIALLGPEVKSLRAGKASLGDAYAAVVRGEIYLRNLHISPYEKAGRENPDPMRERKLLLHRREIARLEGRLGEAGTTLVPLSLYWKEGRCKVELGLVRGRRRYDKRQAIRKREEERDIRRTMRRGSRGAGD
jgi:SsrA-binding protein